MVHDGVRSIEVDCVEGGVLAKVVHPTGGTTLDNQVVLNDVLHPRPGIWVGEINHGKVNAETGDNVVFTRLIFDEVAIFGTFLELILSDAFDTVDILDVGVDVNEGLDTVQSPVRHHAVPVGILVLTKLPVPDQSSALRVLFLTDPILHPDANHG